MKEKFEVFKEFIKKQSSKTKKMIIAGAVVLVIGAVVIALILNNKPYEVLFYELGAEESQQIVNKLQEEGIEFRYKGDSAIMVKSEEVDEVKAKLVQEGYPKSGFTYDTYTQNAGLMTTDSDKQLYKLYELQDRIGATIRSFDGVKDAKVTIALGEESKYALNPDADEKSTATAVVTMKDGGAPTAKQAAAVQRLVAKSVPKMRMEDVAVFDGNMNDVSESSGDGRTGSDAEEIAKVVEEQICKNVLKVLKPIYGDENVRVSVRAQINMEQLIREVTTYNTPEKIDEKDKTGIVSREDSHKENASNKDGAAGVAGAETNADTPNYNTDGSGGSSASSETVSKEYLVNQIKEQGQISPGALDDLTVSVAINQNGWQKLTEPKVKELVGNASGISAEDRDAKIAVASVEFFSNNSGEETKEDEVIERDDALYILIGVAVLLIIIGIVITLLVLKKKKKKKKALLEAEASKVYQSSDTIKGSLPTSQEEENLEILEIQNDKGIELKRNVRDFSDKNPEISAQLIKSWLNGGNDNG